MTIEEQRKEFEKNASKVGIWVDRMYWDGKFTGYQNDEANRAWELWQSCNARYEQVRISDLKDTEYHLVNALGIAVNPLYVIKDKS